MTPLFQDPVPATSCCVTLAITASLGLCLRLCKINRAKHTACREAALRSLLGPHYSPETCEGGVGECFSPFLTCLLIRALFFFFFGPFLTAKPKKLSSAWVSGDGKGLGWRLAGGRGPELEVRRLDY